MKPVIGHRGIGKPVRTIRIMVGERSKVTSLTVLRLER